MIDKIKIDVKGQEVILPDGGSLHLESKFGYLSLHLNGKEECIYMEPELKPYTSEIDEQILKLNSKEQERIYKLLYNLGCRINK